jgi:uncharacterized protein (TIGR04255 family)
MLFPDSERVVYEKNPLTEVICQLRFPPILRIDAEPPVAFQERVRQQYPLYRDAVRQEITLGQLPKQIAQRLGEELGLRKTGMAHNFLSADSNWTVSLTREFLAVSTRSYKRWELFYEHLRLPLEALMEVYAPPFFTRLGLRYQNVIQRSVLGLPDTPWSELLKPYILGELSFPDLAAATTTSFRQTIFRLTEPGSQVRLLHGLAFFEDSGEQNYAIDSDFFTDQNTEPQSAANTLNPFNVQAGRLFRWCITNTLHEAMGPRPIGPGSDEHC